MAKKICLENDNDIFTETGLSWTEFLERYFINEEEFLFIYKGNKYWLLAHDDGGGKCVAEFNYGNDIDGWIHEEYKSRGELIRKVKFENKTIKAVWQDLE